MLRQESAPLVAHGPPQAHHYALNAENKQRPIQLHTQSNNSATNSDCLRWTPPVRHYDQRQRASHKMQKLRPRGADCAHSKGQKERTRLRGGKERRKILHKLGAYGQVFAVGYDGHGLDPENFQ